MTSDMNVPDTVAKTIENNPDVVTWFIQDPNTLPLYEQKQNQIKAVSYSENLIPIINRCISLFTQITTKENFNTYCTYILRYLVVDPLVLPPIDLSTDTHTTYNEYFKSLKDKLDDNKYTKINKIYSSILNNNKLESKEKPKKHIKLVSNKTSE